MPQEHDRAATFGGTPGTTLGEMLEDGLGLIAGLVTMLLPLFITAVPGVVLLLIAPALLVLAVAALPVMLAGAFLAPPYLVVRAIRRGRAGHGRRSLPARRAARRARELY